MKKKWGLLTLTLALSLIISNHVFASDFICPDAPYSTTTTAQVRISQDDVAVVTAAYSARVSTATPPTTNQIQPSDIQDDPANRWTKFFFENLTPGTLYHVFIVDGNNAFVVEPPKCTFLTKSTTPPPPPAGGTGGSGTTGTQTTTTYRIAPTVDNTLKRAQISVTSVLGFQTVGTVALNSPDGVDHPACANITFAPSVANNQCLFLSLTAGKTYTVTVTGKDASNTEYTATGQFTMAGGASTTGGGTAGNTPPVTTTGGSTFTPTNPTNPGASPTSGQATGFRLDVRLDNPLKVDTIQDAVRFFVNTLIRIAIPFIVLFFLWAGLKFILAQGNPEKIKEAKKMFWYTIIGTLLILGAWTITNAIVGTVNSITS